MQTITVRSTKRNELIDITHQVASRVEGKTGLVQLFCTHTTAGLTINENADPDVVHDILLWLDHNLPQRFKGFRHGEGNSDSHLKSSLFGPSLTLIVENGQLQLGTWQGIYFCEFDGPRSRKVLLKIIEG